MDRQITDRKMDRQITNTQIYMTFTDAQIKRQFTDKINGQFKNQTLENTSF